VEPESTMKIKQREREGEREKVKFPPGVFPHFIFSSFCAKNVSVVEPTGEKIHQIVLFGGRARLKRRKEEFIA
jgi:hypothetical protein